jgi:hypothetical protein
MYTNINTPHGLETLQKWFDLHTNNLPPSFPTAMILASVKLIMTMNVFQFDDTHWLQLSGTAMGTSLACMYATIYYAYHEETSLLYSFPPATPGSPLLLYGRLIDDTIQLWDMARLPAPLSQANFTTILAKQMQFGSLPWEVETPQREVNFLDLTIRLEPNGTVTTRTYVKPMNLHLYIPPSSAHSPGVLKSLVYGTLQRYWAQNSNKSNFVASTRAFYGHLHNRGYSHEQLNPVFFSAATSIDARSRNVTSSRPTQPSDRRLFLHWEFHPRDISRRAIRDAYNQTLEPIISTAPLHIRQLTVAYHNPKSLRSCLSKTQLTEPPGNRVSDHVARLGQLPANP